MAVGHERPHAQLRGQGESLPVVGFGLYAFHRIAMRPDLTEEAQGIGLVAAFLDGFRIAGFWPAFWAALIVSITSWIASWFIGSKGRIEAAGR